MNSSLPTRVQTARNKPQGCLLLGFTPTLLTYPCMYEVVFYHIFSEDAVEKSTMVPDGRVRVRKKEKESSMWT